MIPEHSRGGLGIETGILGYYYRGQSPGVTR
jgi:hypothetical protein